MTPLEGRPVGGVEWGATPIRKKKKREHCSSFIWHLTPLALIWT